MAKHSDPQIRRLEPADAALYREIRLEALKQNPEAFGSTFERETTSHHRGSKLPSANEIFLAPFFKGRWPE